MSVLIKGMEMPVIELEWTIRRGADGKWYAIDTNAETSDGQWHEIIHVPPHGRLIDGDVAEGIYFTEEDENGKDFCDGILYAADWISKQPTIIPPSGGKKDE